MRKRIRLLLFVFLFSACPILAGAEVIKLKSANYLPPMHKMSLLGQQFCEEVNKRTNGEVDITYYPGGTLLSPVKMYTGVTQGIADMGLSHTAYTRGRFPVTEVFDLPLGFPSGYVAAQISNDFYNKFKPAEWNDVHVLYFATSGPLILQTVAKPVRTLKDMSGLKIRATGRMSDIVKSLGGLPVPLEMPDVYESLRRQVLDGVMVDLSTLKYWKFAEVIKYVTATWRLGTGYTFYFVMNKDKWNRLSPGNQKIFTQVAFDIKEKQAALWNEMDIEGRDMFVKGGGKMIDLSNAEVAKWIKAVQPVINAYVKEMVDKGYKEREVKGWIKYIRERIKYWRNQEKRRGIASPYFN